MFKVVLVASALMAGLPLLACAKGSGVVRTLTLEARGVSFTAEVNGRKSELLSSGSTSPVASAVPLGKGDFKTRSGVNELVIRIEKVDPSQGPFLTIDLQESAKGDVISTEGGATRHEPFPIQLEGDRLKGGARLSYHFALP